MIKVVAYDASPQHLALTTEEITSCNGVLLYSQRTAKIWMEEMARLNLFPRLTHFCLSRQISDVLSEKWRRRAASEATEASLLELIDLTGKSA